MTEVKFYYLWMSSQLYRDNYVCVCVCSWAWLSVLNHVTLSGCPTASTFSPIMPSCVYLVPAASSRGCDSFVCSHTQGKKISLLLTSCFLLSFVAWLSIRSECWWQQDRWERSRTSVCGTPTLFRPCPSSRTCTHMASPAWPLTWMDRYFM